MIYVSAGLIILAFIFKAVCDTLDYHFTGSIFDKPHMQYWWSPNSWLNPYKDRDYTKGPKFFGATTFLIMFMSAWHCFDFLKSIAFISAFTLYAFHQKFWLYLLSTTIIFVIGSAIFELLYGKVFKKKAR